MAQQTKDAPETAAAPEATGGETFARGVKIAGEAFVVPGSSLILDGKMGLEELFQDQE